MEIVQIVIAGELRIFYQFLEFFNQFLFTVMLGEAMLLKADIIRMVWYTWISIIEVCLLLSHTGAQYAAIGHIRPTTENDSVEAEELHIVPQNLYNMLLRILNFAEVSFLFSCPEWIRDISIKINR